MFKPFVFLGLITVLLCGTAAAAEDIKPKAASSEYKYIEPNYSDVKHRNFALGIIAGEPSGISGKLWTGTNTAIDGAIAWSTGTHNDINLHFDYLMHNFTLLNENQKNIILYYGVGARLKYKTIDDDKDSMVGLRIPLGVTYLFPTAPFDVFFEVAPILDLIPDSDLEISAGIGVRYYFW